MKDADKKAKMMDEFFSEKLPQELKVLEKHLTANKNGNGFFVGNELTWADIIAADFLSGAEKFRKGASDSSSILVKHMEFVNNQKGIKEWIAKRPDSDL